MVTVNVVKMTFLSGNYVDSDSNTSEVNVIEFEPYRNTAPNGRHGHDAFVYREGDLDDVPRRTLTVVDGRDSLMKYRLELSPTLGMVPESMDESGMECACDSRYYKLKITDTVLPVQCRPWCGTFRLACDIEWDQVLCSVGNRTVYCGCTAARDSPSNMYNQIVQVQTWKHKEFRLWCLEDLVVFLNSMPEFTHTSTRMDVTPDDQSTSYDPNSERRVTRLFNFRLEGREIILETCIYAYAQNITLDYRGINDNKKRILTTPYVHYADPFRVDTEHRCVSCHRFKRWFKAYSFTFNDVPRTAKEFACGLSFGCNDGSYNPHVVETGTRGVARETGDQIEPVTEPTPERIYTTPYTVYPIFYRGHRDASSKNEHNYTIPWLPARIKSVEMYMSLIPRYNILWDVTNLLNEGTVVQAEIGATYEDFKKAEDRHIWRPE